MRTLHRVRRAAGPAPVRPEGPGRTRTARAAVLLGTSLALGLTACGPQGEPGTSPTTSPPPTSAPEPTPTPEPQPGVWPLTGVYSDAVVSRPALAVKIENTPAARPQSGLESADVVWEQIVEFEVPRLLAVFHSELPEVVGPIRSVRPVDTRIAAPLGGLLVYSGGQDGILADVADTDLQSVSHDDGDEGMYRIDSRAAPHNVYGSPAALLEQADGAHQDPPPEQFAFAPAEKQATAALEGQETAWVTVRLSSLGRPTWEWEPESATWLRSEGTTPATDTSGGRLSAKNVVVVEVPAFDSGYDAQGGEPVPDLELEGRGHALLASGGRTLEVEWTKESPADPLLLETEDGAAAELAPGTTWVELMPATEGSYQVGGATSAR